MCVSQGSKTYEGFFVVSCAFGNVWGANPNAKIWTVVYRLQASSVDHNSRLERITPGSYCMFWFVTVENDVYG